MNLSEKTSEVVGFDSTWDEDKEVFVKDTGTEVMENQLEVSDKNIGTKETKEMGVQASTVVLSNSNEEIDKKLAAWLKKVMPAVERELKEGPTQVCESSKIPRNDSWAQVSEYQQLDVKQFFAEATEDNEELIIGVATWLSVSIQNNPVLVISCYMKSSLNEPKTSHLIVYEPQRSKADGNVYWQEVSNLPIKEPIDFIVTKADNRDIFAGASASGLYIWNYIKVSASSSEPRLIEIFSKASEDSIVGITFLNDDVLVCCANDGNLIAYKIINKQNCIVDKIMKIDQKRLKESTITVITNVINSNDFVIGLLNGKIFYCSTNQILSQESAIDPVVKEMHSHKFAVKALKSCEHSSKNFIISYDASSEIFIHEIEDDSSDRSLKYVIRLPLPIKNTIALTNNMQHIFCPLSNGSLEIFNAKSNTRRTMEGSHNSGNNNNVAELSRNESWLITGVFSGVFKIFHISFDDE